VTAVILDVETTGIDEPDVIQLARARFEALIERIPEAGCWLWLGETRKSGSPYGRWCCRSISRTERYAHRFSWLLFRGPIPEGMDVLHRCDVHSCVNPYHLFIGTPADNTADMMAKGRHRHNPDVVGDANPRAKLTDLDVMNILSSPLNGLRLADKYNVTSTTIYFIRQGKTWTHIPRDFDPYAETESYFAAKERELVEIEYWRDPGAMKVLWGAA
jgi:hypothetical protein